MTIIGYHSNNTNLTIMNLLKTIACATLLFAVARTLTVDATQPQVKLTINDLDQVILPQ